MADNDEGLFVTQNSFISANIAESDVISDEEADIEQRFDWLLDNAETSLAVCSFGDPIRGQMGSEGVQTKKNWCYVTGLFVV